MGSGSSSFGWSGGTDAGKLLQSGQDEEQKSAYSQTTNSYLSNQLLDYNDRDTEAIRTHIERLRAALDKELDDPVELVYGGSVSKHTYVSGISDVDLLAILKDPALASMGPEVVRQYFAKRIGESLPGTQVEVGVLAVNVTFTDGQEIQILPAVRTATGVRISSPDGTSWSGVIRPREFSRRLVEVNQARSGRLVPVVKLFKAMNDKMPEDAKLSGYHAESLAVDAFQDYSGNLDYKSMLRHLADYSRSAVLDPIPDVTDQSENVDSYLGPAGSVKRQRVSDALERVVRKMDEADSKLSVERWEDLF